MRRYVWVPLAVLALALGACSTGTQAKRTVTEIVTATGTPPTTANSSAPTGSAGITVVNPNGSGSTSGTPTGAGSGSSESKSPTTESTPTSPSTTQSTPTTSTATKTTATSKEKIVKVDPLQVACPTLLDANDIQKALGVKVSTSNFRIVDVANPDVKMTGKVKCYFGAKSSSKSRPVTVALAQYKSASAAQSQMNVTVQSETSLGADASTAKVSGQTAHILLRDGGLLVLRYDTWTLSVAVDKGVVGAKKLPSGLQDLARMVLARVLKNG